MPVEALTKTFKRWYVVLLTPPCLAMLGLALERAEVSGAIPAQADRPVVIFILVLAGLLAFALPLWLRILFAKRHAGRQGVERERFIRFEKRFICVGLLATYMVPLGYLCRIPQVPLFWIMLFALYAGYYYFPSKKRINLELKIFRVRGVS
jgi:hypothetical protein